MDQMKFKLSTKFMRTLLAKLISKVIFNKFGFKPELQIKEIEVEMRDSKIYFRINVDGEIDDKVFTKIARIIDEEEL